MPISYLNETKNKSLVKDYKKLFNTLFKNTKVILKIEYELIMCSVTFIDEDKAHDLNLKYRDKDAAGDVISFPINMDQQLCEELEFCELGDIFICYDLAINKAQQYDHTIEQEMAWLFVHGLLHLLGYDHEIDQEQENIMFSLTDKILGTLNIVYNIDKVIGV